LGVPAVSLELLGGLQLGLNGSSSSTLSLHAPWRMRSSATVLSLRSTHKPSFVPLTYEERVRKAMVLYDAPPEGWTLKDCYKRIDVGRSKFIKYMRLEAEGILTQEKINGKAGRPLYLSDQAKQELHDEVPRRSLSLKSVKQGSIFYNLVADKIQSLAFNELAEIKLSEFWLYKLIAELFTVIPQADIKNDARLKAFENICNPLSLCAMVHSYEQRGANLIAGPASTSLCCSM
ncbi:hypothetical protein B484DRAFT_440304, partial [Ochromonadaceae sp. CCMP2298]